MSLLALTVLGSSLTLTKTPFVCFSIYESGINSNSQEQIRDQCGPFYRAD